MLWLAGLAAGYVLAAKLGLRLPVLHPGGAPAWAPTGIALAALLRLGFRAWPAILVGAFLAHLTTAGSALVTLGVLRKAKETGPPCSRGKKALCDTRTTHAERAWYLAT